MISIEECAMQSRVVGGRQKLSGVCSHSELSHSGLAWWQWQRRDGDYLAPETEMMMVMAAARERLGEQRVQQTKGSACSAWTSTKMASPFSWKAFAAPRWL